MPQIRPNAPLFSNCQGHTCHLVSKLTLASNTVWSSLHHRFQITDSSSQFRKTCCHLAPIRKWFRITLSHEPPILSLFSFIVSCLSSSVVRVRQLQLRRAPQHSVGCLTSSSLPKILSPRWNTCRDQRVHVHGRRKKKTSLISLDETCSLDDVTRHHRSPPTPNPGRRGVGGCWSVAL